MRKRLRKKVGQRQCLKCGCRDGVRQWSPDRHGKYRVGPLACIHCDMGMPREPLAMLGSYLHSYEETLKTIRKEVFGEEEEGNGRVLH